MSKTFTTLSFGGTSVADDQPVRVALSQGEYRHEIMTATVSSMSTDSKRYQTGVPVELVWGDSPTNKQLFLGYVSHVEPMYDSGRYSTDTHARKNVVCMGASFVYKNAAYLNLKNVTASVMARRMCTVMRFDSSGVQDHDRVWPTLTQGGKSYWLYLAELAQRIGYTMYARGTDLYFHDRLSAAARFRGQVPSFSTGGGGLAKFESQVGKSTPMGGELADRVLYGTDSRTGRPILGQQQNARQKPLLGREGLAALFVQGETGRAVDSPQEARDELSAMARQNQLPVTAKIKVRGNPKVQVGGLVHLGGIDSVNDGLWYVTGTKHVFDGPNEYMTEALVGRDAVVAASNMPSTLGVDVPKPRGSRLVNGLWVTA